MPKDFEGPKKPGKVYWIINTVILGLAALVFLIDVVLWRRFTLSLLWLIITGVMAVFCYVQFKNAGEKK